jgi:hypothetical protein
MENITATRFAGSSFKYRFARNEATRVIVVSTRQGVAIDMFIEDGYLDTIAQRWLEDFTDETGANLFR